MAGELNGMGIREESLQIDTIFRCLEPCKTSIGGLP